MKRESDSVWERGSRMSEAFPEWGKIRGDILPKFERFFDRVELTPLSGGLINDTYCVAGEEGSWILQRLNPDVFPDPAGIMANLRVLLDHAHRELPETSRLSLPDIRPTITGSDFWVDSDGVLWRGLTLIPKSRNIRSIREREEAVEVGRALGWFHRLTESLPSDALKDTFPGFHVTPRYLGLCDMALGNSASPYQGDDAPLDFIAARRSAAGALEAARANGALKVRVMHGDPKLDNVLFSRSGVQAISLIDLDTVMPGLIHYDLGDCLRSCCNASGEAGKADVSFNVEIFEAVLEGYFAEAASGMTPVDIEYIYTATWLLPYELGIRFFTDHIQGDLYFKVGGHGENLKRALRQFDLVRDIEHQEERLRRAIQLAWARV